MNKINIIFIVIVFSIIPIHGMESVNNNIQQECEQSVNQVPLIEEHIKKVCEEHGASHTCEVISESFKHYAQEDKDAALKKLMKLDDATIERCRNNSKKIKQCVKDYYESIRLPALILICAGANHTIKLHDCMNLLSVAVEFNDMHMVKKLFEYKVDPNIADGPFNSPLLLSVTTKEMAQILIDNGIDLHNDRLRDCHALRTMLRNKFPLELIEFYLAKGVGQTESDNFCWDLLCELTDYLSNNTNYFGCVKKDYSINDINTLFKKAELLCKYIPQGMINTLKGRDTLIDKAQWKLRCSSRDTLLAEFYENLITLYRQHGGLTGCEVYKDLASQAEEYNQTNPLLSALPHEVLGDIFSYYQEKNQKQKESLQDSIKNFMRLHGTCKKLNQCLTSEVIGDLCKNYTQHDKDTTLCKIVESIEPSRYSNIRWHSYQSRRLPASILVCAGAYPNIKPEHGGKYLLEHALCHDDEQMVKTLFKHKVDPHKNGREYHSWRLESAVLACKTRNMAQIFIDNGVELYDPVYPNVVWRMLGDDYSSDVFNYCAKKVDLTELYNPSQHDEQLRVYSEKETDKNYICLLHQIASSDGKRTLKNSDQLLEKAIFLLEAMPKEMVNSVCKKGTPIDVAQNNCTKERRQNGSLVQFYEKLVCLYRKYGGLSSFILNKKLAEEVKEYNHNHFLLSRLSLEDFKEKIVHEQDQEKSLTESIKNCMQLRGVCKKFNQLFTNDAISALCKDYTQEDKNNVLKKIASLFFEGYGNKKENKRLAVLLLVCAGADPNTKVCRHYKNLCLLEYAVDTDDEYMVEALLKHKVDLNVTNPALYKTKKIAQLFIDKGVDVQVPVDDYPNVLWRVVEDTYPADLLEFYLEKGVDPKQLSRYDYYGSKQDLLCYVTDGVRDSHGNYHRDKIKKVKLLVKAMPEKINAIWGWRTLLDIAQDKYGQYKADGYTYSSSFEEKLIALYRKYGGLTAEELGQ